MHNSIDAQRTDEIMVVVSTRPDLPRAAFSVELALLDCFSVAESFAITVIHTPLPARFKQSNTFHNPSVKYPVYSPCDTIA